MRSIAILLSVCLCAGPLWAEDAEMAAALATSASKLHTQGKKQKAKKLCYKALAYDGNCPEAMFLLATIFQEEGREAAAGNFFVRAARELEKAVKTHPQLAPKLRKAKARARELNPYASRLQYAMAEYAKSLGAIIKRSPDSLTIAEAQAQAKRLQLIRYVDKDKLPKELTQAPPPKTPTRPRRPGPNAWGRRIPRRPAATAPKTKIAPDIERALKANGWTKITGSWKKLGPNKYEVTDGRLEAEKLNGAVTCIVHRGGKGTVSVFVRNDKKEEGWRSSFSGSGFGGGTGSGYGVVLRRAAAKVYTPSEVMGGDGGRYSPWMNFTKKLPANYPKDLILISINKTKLDISINNKRINKSNYPIEESGTFLIKIQGTKTIENPKNLGR